MMDDVVDRPLAEMVAQAKELIDEGGTVYQKFTCSGCGQRLMMDEPNVFYRTGTCDRCETITDIEASGCGFMLMIVRPR